MAVNFAPMYSQDESSPYSRLSGNPNLRAPGFGQGGANPDPRNPMYGAQTPGSVLYGQLTPDAAGIAERTKAQERQIAGSTQQAQIAAGASMYPATLQQERFRTILPYLTGELGTLGTSPYTIGGASPPSPEITVGPVMNEQQIQQQVNAQRAAGEQATASQIRNMQGNLAGRGFGGQSPLAQALGAQYQSQNLARGQAAERETRLGAQQANVEQILKGQQAREAQFATRQQEAIQRAQPYFQQRNILLQALAGLA